MKQKEGGEENGAQERKKERRDMKQEGLGKRKIRVCRTECEKGDLPR